MLTRAATNQEREMDGLIAALLGILEPALIVTMGIIVLVIVLAILLPIFELRAADSVVLPDRGKADTLSGRTTERSAFNP